jgi:hypothetical protein
VIRLQCDEPCMPAFSQSPKAREARRGVRSVGSATGTTEERWTDLRPNCLPLGAGTKAPAPAGPQGSRSSDWRASRPGDDPGKYGGAS